VLAATPAQLWIVFATTSLPVPLSPLISTAAAIRETRDIVERSIGAERPQSCPNDRDSHRREVADLAD
jgi:hypothetical protein